MEVKTDFTTFRTYKHMVFPKEKEPNTYSFSKFTKSKKPEGVTVGSSLMTLNSKEEKSKFYKTCNNKFTSKDLTFDSRHMDQFITSDLNKVHNLK